MILTTTFYNKFTSINFYQKNAILQNCILVKHTLVFIDLFKQIQLIIFYFIHVHFLGN